MLFRCYLGVISGRGRFRGDLSAVLRCGSIKGAEKIPNKKEIKIALATPEDAYGMQEVYYKTWLDTYPNEEIGVTVEDIEYVYKDAFTLETLAKRSEHINNPPEGHTVFFAKEGDKVIGLCQIVESEDQNCLQAIYVLPEYQGKGVGGQLWTEAQKVCNKDKDIVVSVATYNTGAIRFYEDLGFIDTGKRFTEERFRMESGAIIIEMEMIIKAKK